MDFNLTRLQVLTVKVLLKLAVYGQVYGGVVYREQYKYLLSKIFLKN